MLYTTQTLIHVSIKTLFLFRGHTWNLTPEILLYRYEAEPSLCKHTIFFRVACERFLPTCRNDGNPLKLKLPFFIDCSLPYPILSFTPCFWFIRLQNCFVNRNVDTFVSEMHFWKISKICNFWLKT